MLDRTFVCFKEVANAHMQGKGSSSFAQNIDFSAGTAAAKRTCVRACDRMAVCSCVSISSGARGRSCCLLTCVFIFIASARRGQAIMLRNCLRRICLQT